VTLHVIHQKLCQEGIRMLQIPRRTQFGVRTWDWEDLYCWSSMKNGRIGVRYPNSRMFEG
jgi:hypothetical protein